METNVQNKEKMTNILALSLKKQHAVIKKKQNKTGEIQGGCPQDSKLQDSVGVKE